ncbi:MAG: hypothetical protein VKL60_10070 [Sphaerospermopsis sp.]|nr:hypothetical protein [Sphaerospermopsis sp.]
MLIINHYYIEWIEDWCAENGWTDLFVERRGNYWAFPPGCVIPEPIPMDTLKLIKQKNGATSEEILISVVAVIITILCATCAFICMSPMPLVVAFAFDAVTVAQLEIEE